MLYYIFTFLFCLLGDYLNNKKFKTVLIIWLYIFLCFGYMTGSDWRGYENFYGNKFKYDYAVMEKGFWFISYYIEKFIPDFFIFLGVVKCLYLYSVIKLIKSITDKYLSIIAFLMPLTLMFMLIDNPLRFMIANIFLNIGIYYLIKDKLKYFFLFSIISVFFHMVTLFIFPIFLLLKMKKFINSIGKYKLIIIYILFSILVSNISLVSSVSGFFVIFVGELKDYGSYYSVEDNNTFFTIGSLLGLIYGCFIIWNKNLIVNLKNGDVYCLTIIYLFLNRFVLIIPTGFRLVIPFSLFYAVAFIYILLRKDLIIKSFFLTLITFTMALNIYNSYTYIPYSNSIYYILTKHLPYSYRDQYNRVEYQNRTGKALD